MAASPRKILLTVLWLLLGLPPWVAGQSVDATKLTGFREHMQSYVERQEFAGIVTVIGRGDGILSHEAIGGSYGHSGALHTNAWIDPHRDLFTIVLMQRQGLANADGEAMKAELQALAETAVRQN